MLIIVQQEGASVRSKKNFHLPACHLALQLHPLPRNKAMRKQKIQTCQEQIKPNLFNFLL